MQSVHLGNPIGEFFGGPPELTFYSRSPAACAARPMINGRASEVAHGKLAV